MASISYPAGSMWDAETDVLVNPVNCAGVMGKGIALVFKESMPVMYELYRLTCQRRQLEPGDLFVYHLYGGLTVINAATKGHYRYPAKINYLQDVATNLDALAAQWDIPLIAMPKIGCGEGGLAWWEVRDLLLPLRCHIEVYTDLFEARPVNERTTFDVEPFIYIVSRGGICPLTVEKDFVHEIQRRVEGGGVPNRDDDRSELDAGRARNRKRRKK